MSRQIAFNGDPLQFGGLPLVFGPPQPPAGLGPLANSHEADDLEAELKAAFMEVFEFVLRARLVRLGSYGMPHRGDFEVLERFVKAAGLALERRDDAEAYMRELFRAWVSNNPRRGLHFLRHYLQLLFPGQATLSQLWQDPALPYPSGASELPIAGGYRTSRVRLLLGLDGDTDGSELAKVMGSLRSVIPARIVLEVTTLTEIEGEVRVAAVVEGTEHEEWAITASP